jgi:phage tail sheath protein FI
LSDQDYVHGIRVVKGDGEVRVVLTPNQAIVGVVGTADAPSEALAIDTPVAYLKKETALNAIRPSPETPDTGTLYASVRAIFAQGARVVVVVRSQSGSVSDLQRAIEKLLQAEAVTSYKPKLLCAPGHTALIPAAPQLRIAETETKERTVSNREKEKVNG